MKEGDKIFLPSYGWGVVYEMTIAEQEAVVKFAKHTIKIQFNEQKTDLP